MLLAAVRWGGAFHHLTPLAVVFADTPNWTNLLANQLPIAVLVVIIGLAGDKKKWRYGHQYDETVQRLEAEKAQIIKDRDAEFARREVEAQRIRDDAEAEGRRLATEREREASRAQKYEDYTMRLLEEAKSAVRIAADAVGKRGAQ